MQRTRRVQSGDVELAVWERGEAGRPTVLLVHGYPDTHAVWDEVAGRLAERFHVVQYDVRGAGASGAPRRRSGYRLPQLAADLRAVADATSPERPVHVAGHDWGSMQAWEPLTEPSMAHRFASFTSISGPCLDHVGHWRRRMQATPEGRRKLADQAIRSWYIYAFHVPLLVPALWRTVLPRVLPRSLRRREGVPESSTARSTLADDGVHGLHLYRQNVFPRLLFPRDRRTSAPVQLIVPRGDAYASPELTEGVERWAPRLWRRLVDGGHWILRTRPDDVARWIAELVDHAEGAAEAPELARCRVD